MTSQPVDGAQHKMTDVCIQITKKPVPSDFKYILKEGFLRHGIATRDYVNLPPDCTYWLSYHATTYSNHGPASLRDVHLAIYSGTSLIGYADRDSPKGFWGKEVTDLSQWDSTRSILDPLVDALLESCEITE